VQEKPPLLAGKRRKLLVNNNYSKNRVGYSYYSKEIWFYKYVKMKPFKIVPLSGEYASAIRETRKDDFGNTVMEQLATGFGPCRVSLKPFKPGEDKRLLFSHSPFLTDNAFNQTGPVFIHAGEVEEYADVSRFPPEIKADKVHFPLTLIGYSADQQMVYTRLVGDNDIDELIERIFSKHPEIEYLHARNAEAGCYICKIERAGQETVGEDYNSVAGV
jgi:Protein of unknown function (DUF1203)